MFDLEDMIEEFLAEAQEHRGRIEELLLGMEQCEDTEVLDMVNELFRAVHSIKGAAGTVELDNLCALTHAMETELSKVREGVLEVTPTLVSALLGALDVLDEMLADLHQHEKVDYLPAVAALTQSSDSTVQDDGGDESVESEHSAPAVAANEPQTVAQEQKTSSAATRPSSGRGWMDDESAGPPSKPLGSRRDSHKKNSGESIRVPVWALDSLMALAGELVLVRNRQLQSVDERLRRDRNSVSNMDRQLTQQLDLVTSEIQEAVLRTRMQPIGIAFQKLPRLCRDLANRLGKSIEYSSIGSETEVDKTILECLSDPLLHLVRNACDHGLGTAAERMAQGKPPTGSIRVSAFQDGGQIVIRVQDDGRGINLAQVGQKALEKRICRPQELESMSEKEICMLIFAPGFSTAGTISDVSGRGVGMDVVKTSIEKIGGSVDVSSKLGQGTTFSMRVPLTLAIVSSLVVRNGDCCFAIPQVNLEEVVCLHDDEVSKRIEFINNQPCFRLRGQLLPLVHLDDVLGHGESIPKSALIRRRDEYETNPPGRLTFAVVRLGVNSFGIVVDEAVGTEEIVVKPNHPILSKVRCFVGSTVLGDGKIALILDINGIAQHAALESRFAESSYEQNALPETLEVLQQLSFTTTGDDSLLFPLSLISRVVLIHHDSIDALGDVCTVNVNGENIRVVDIAKHLGTETHYEGEELALILPRHIKRSVGFLCKKVLDIRNVSTMPSSDTHRHPAVLGSLVLDEKLALMLDMFALARAEEPTWFESEARQEDVKQSAPRRILLAEDTAFFRKVVGAYLVDLGYDVEVANDGLVASEILRQKGHGIELLISDIEMPHLDGFGLIEKLRRNREWEHCRCLPALAMSSLSSPEVQRKALELGFDNYELKLSRESLKDTLEEMFASRPRKVSAA